MLSNGNAADPGAGDHNRDLLAGLVNSNRPVPTRARTRIDLDLAIDQVDDPVNRDASAPEAARFLPRSRARVLSDTSTRSDVRGLRVARAIGIARPSDHREIRFGLVEVENPYRAFFS